MKRNDRSVDETEYLKQFTAQLLNEARDLWPVLAKWVGSRLILSYRQKKLKMSIWGFHTNEFIKPSSSIPMLQIAIKHLKWSLFVRFLRSTFPLLTSGRLLLLIITSKEQHSSFVNIHILNDMSPNHRNMIFKPMLMKTKWSRWLTFAKPERAISLIKYIIAKYVLTRFTQT